MLVALITLGPCPGWTQPAPPAAGTIGVPEIAQRAEEAGIVVRDLQARLAPSPELDDIRQKISAVNRDLSVRLAETKLILETQPDIDRLDALADSWRARRLDVLRWMVLVTARATQLEGEIERLKTLRARWRQARADASAAQAPPAVLERVDSVLAALDALDGPLQQRRAADLVLQDQVAQEVTRCEDALALLDAARRGAATRLFARETPPIWTAESKVASWRQMIGRIRESLSITAWDLRNFLGESLHLIMLQVVVFLLLAAAARIVRSRQPEPTPSAEMLTTTAKAFEHPLAAAVLVTVLVTFGIYPHSLRDLVAIVGLLPLLVVVRPLVDASLRPWLWAFGLLVLADRIRQIAGLTPLLDQGPVFLETGIGIAGLGWFLLWSRSRPVVHLHGNALVIAARVMLLVFMGAFVANAIGNVTFAELLVGGTLRGSYRILVLSAGVVVSGGLVAYALGSPLLQRLWMVQRHGPRLERRALQLLRWLAVGLWVLTTLQDFALLQPTAALVETVLSARFQRGALSLSLGDVLAFVVTIWLSFLVSSFIRFVLREDVFPRIPMAPGLPYATTAVLHYLILFAGFLLGVAALGVDLNRFTIIGGALGVGIGFGLQNVVNNFVSGLIVLFERPVRVGDSVQIGDVMGDVRHIGIRATTLRTYEGAEVIVPNSMLVSERVTNWTLSDRARRVTVQVGVAYGTAPDTVFGLLGAVARATPHVASLPAPIALFVGFGDSALNFELRVWTDGQESWPQVRSDLTVAVYAALREAGIDIPFPQRDIRLRADGGGDGLPRRP